MNEPWTKDSTPLFSVLIANYNNGQYLEECLQSVFDQTYTNWEIIIVDDGSTDIVSKKIYDKIKDNPKIWVFFNERNMGCGFAKRKCIAEAKGAICGFLDPDDTLEKTALEKATKQHKSFPSASLIYSTHFLCDEELNVIKTNDRVGEISAGESYLSSFNNDKVVSHFATFKTSLYRQTKGINQSLKRAVDQDLYYKLEEVGNFVYINEPLYFYRYYRVVGKEGLSSAGNELKAQYWHLKVIDQARERRRKGLNIKTLPRKLSIFYWEQYYFSMANSSLKENRPLRYFQFILISLIFYPLNRTLLKIKLLLKPIVH